MDSESRSQIACSAPKDVHQQLPGFIGIRVPATGPRGPVLAIRPESFLLSLCGGFLLAKAEVGAVHHQVGDRRLLPQRFQGNLRLQC